MAGKICIIGVEDTLQPLMLTAIFGCIKNRHKDACISLVMDRKDKDLSAIIDNVDEFVLFDKEGTLQRLSSGKYTVVENHEHIRKQLKGVLSGPVDLVINAGCDNLSAILTSTIDARSVEGVTFDEYGRKWVENPWFSYMDSVYEYGRNNLFHYIDMVSSGCEAFKPGGSVPVMQDTSPKRVVIALGSAEAGKAAAMELGRRIETSYPDFAVAVVEEQDIEAMSALLRDTTILFTSDPLWSMMAGHFGKRVVLLAPDRSYVLRGPYGEGHFVLNRKDGAQNINDDLFSFFGSAFCHQDKTTLMAPSLEILISRYDRDGFLEYVPYIKTRMNEEEFYNWIYKSVWKCTIGRSIKAGDPQRFLAFGEKYIDRVVDIDIEVEYLAEKVLPRYDQDSVRAVTMKFSDMMNSITNLKDTAFEGQKKAREFLNAVAISSEDLEEIKRKRREIAEVDNQVRGMLEDGNACLAPLVRSFTRERDDAHIVNLFPLAKRIIVTYEDLFSKASFLEEIIKGLWKRIN